MERRRLCPGGRQGAAGVLARVGATDRSVGGASEEMGVRLVVLLLSRTASRRPLGGEADDGKTGVPNIRTKSVE
jgi:hypothetical protein